MNFSLLPSLPLFLLLFTAVEGVADPQQCGGPPTTTQLTFFGSTLVTNTLHLQDGMLRYQNVGTYKDETLDLVVTVFNGTYTNITNMWADRNTIHSQNYDHNFNGYMGGRQFGNINLQYHYGAPNSGVGQFEFSIVQTGTMIPVVLESFGFTVWDLDERGNDNTNNNEVKPSIKEKLSFNTADAYNYSVFPNFADSWVKPICENGDAVECTDQPFCSGVHPGHLSCGNDTRTVFRSSHSGGLNDNPRDPEDLTYKDDQIRKQAVFFLFENTSTFRFTYSIYCAIEDDHVTPGAYQGPYENADECKPGNKYPYSGGNFLFSGESEALYYKEGCPTNAPTPVPTPAPTPYPTEAGACNMNRTLDASYGQVKFCVRSSYGYKYGPSNDIKYKEVNFIESLIKINYYLAADFTTFCVQEFNVEPKERVETTANEDQFGLQAWLCDVNLSEVDPIRTLPQRVTNYLTDGGTDAYNQGALITVCVAPDDDAYEEGIRMSSLTDFKWNRNSFEGMGSLEVEQTAIEYSLPASNFLTYYDDSACSGAEWCSFSSVLFADFYMSRGNVTGSGNAKLQFGERRLTEGRRLQEGADSSKFDLGVGVNGIGDGRASLKTAGAVSSRFSVLPGIFVLLSGVAILV